MALSFRCFYFTEKAYSAGKEKDHEYPQAHRLHRHVCRAGHAYGSAVAANRVVLRNWSAGQRQSGERCDCRGLGISASGLSHSRWLLSPQCAPYAGVLRDLRGIPRNHALGDVPRLDAERGDFRGVRQQRGTGVVHPSRAALRLEESETAGRHRISGVAAFYSRRASCFLLYW